MKVSVDSDTFSVFFQTVWNLFVNQWQEAVNATRRWSERFITSWPSWNAQVLAHAALQDWTGSILQRGSTTRQTAVQSCAPGLNVSLHCHTVWHVTEHLVETSQNFFYRWSGGEWVTHLRNLEQGLICCWWGQTAGHQVSSEATDSLQNQNVIILPRHHKL